MKNLRLFLPQISSEQLRRFANLEPGQSSFEVQPLQLDWEQQFCSFIGVAETKLPWTQLRLAQYELTKNIKTAVCCDPVLMQLTHRGAYMLGQDSMQLSQSEAIRIVAQINERLMDSGEQLLLVDKYSWLFTSERELTLSDLSYKDLIGKDVFNYPYAGDHAQFWQQLSTEIQMLIKQMIDYQGVSSIAPDTLFNVHFSNAVDVSNPVEMPFVKNESIAIVTDNELIQSFCSKSFLAQYLIADREKTEQENLLIIAFDSECEQYPDLVDFWIESSHSGFTETSELICKDVVFKTNNTTGFLSKLRRFFQ